MSKMFPGLVLIVAGLLATLGAAFNWSLVTRSGKLINRLLGDRAARVVYFLVGIFLFVLGVGTLIGADWLLR